MFSLAISLIQYRCLLFKKQLFFVSCLDMHGLVHDFHFPLIPWAKVD